jgi:hypothetical protein
LPDKGKVGLAQSAALLRLAAWVARRLEDPKLARDLAIRFLLGGAIVSLFSVTGDLWRPKSFAGIFGAAPSVALASLALTAGKQGPAVVAVLGRSMVLGSVALLAYAMTCVLAAKHHRWPVWLSAVGAWLVWMVVALGALRVAAIGGTLI